MLENTRVTAFIVSELLIENQQARGGGAVKSPPPPHSQIRVNKLNSIKTIIFTEALNKIFNLVFELTRPPFHEKE